MADPITWGALISAAVGVGTTVYTQGKAEDAAESKARANALSQKENMELGEQRSKAERERMLQQSATKEAGNALAFGEQSNAMTRAAAAEKRAQDEARALAANDPANEYAAKFKPGSGEAGRDSATNFLVPRVAEGTGLVADNTPGVSGTGLQTPLGFSI